MIEMTLELEVSKVCSSKGIKVVNKLSEDGSEGVIFSGIIIKNCKECIIKVIDISTMQNYSNFQNEIENMSIVQGSGSDPHQPSRIVHLYQSFQKDNNGYIVMERMDLDLIDYVMQRGGTLKELEAKWIFKQICKAVQHCHNKAVSHMDLKPENILLRLHSSSSSSPLPIIPSTPCPNDDKAKGKNGDERKMERRVSGVKLCDFGHSFDYSAFSSRKIANIFKQRGTKQYRAPEISLSKTLSPVAADTWSLGVVLYVMLTGLFPQATVSKSSMDTDLSSVLDTPDLHLISESEDEYMFFSSAFLGDFASPSARDLVLRLLQYKANDRLSIDEVLSHPWLRGAHLYIHLPSPSLFGRLDNDCEDDGDAVDHADNDDDDNDVDAAVDDSASINFSR